MFGLGFLLIAILYFFAITYISKRLPAKAKKYFVLVAVVVPTTYPFWYLIYPSYYEFQRLCEAEDRYVIKKIQEVDYLYSDSGCHLAFKNIQGRSFKGYDCEDWRRVGEASYPREKKLYRFSPAENWSGPMCQYECLKNPSVVDWEDRCQAKCFHGVEISEPELKYGSTYATAAIIKDKLFETRLSKINDKREELAVLKNYTYFKYGTGWATILGGSSGSAPSLTCEKKLEIYRYDFLKPISKK